MRDILVHIGHPAHVHLFRYPVREWRREGRRVTVALRDKDQTVELARRYGLDGPVLSRFRPGAAGLIELIQQDLGLARLSWRTRPVLVGTSIGAAQVGRLLGLPAVVLFEDDVDVLGLMATLTYPFATAIVAPDGVRMGRWESRTLHYPSCQKLFYLHPDRFRPDPEVRGELGLAEGEPFGIVRLSALQALHDRGIRGISADFVRDLTEGMAGRGIRVFVSSEKPLPPELEPFRFAIPPDRMHDALGLAAFFLGDSQSMTVEAALLGTPAFRLNSFADRISIINDLESYGLAFSFRPGEEAQLLARMAEVLGREASAEALKAGRARLLKDKIDPLPWFLEVVRQIEKRTPLEEIRRQAGAGRA